MQTVRHGCEAVPLAWKMAWQEEGRSQDCARKRDTTRQFSLLQPASESCLCSSSSWDWVRGLDPQRLITTSLLAMLPPHKVLLLVWSSKGHYTAHRESWCWEMGCSEPDVWCKAVQRRRSLRSWRSSETLLGLGSRTETFVQCFAHLN